MRIQILILGFEELNKKALDYQRGLFSSPENLHGFLLTLLFTEKNTPTSSKQSCK